MLRETKLDLTSVEASASQFPTAARATAVPSRLRAKALQSLQDSMLAMIDYATALECHAAAPEAVIREIMHLSQSIDMLGERLATLAGPPCETPWREAASDVAAPVEKPSPIFPVPVRPVRENQGQKLNPAAILRQMSPREIAVLEQLVMGLPNKLIAFELGISVVTVKAHIGAILRKMNVHSRNRVIAMLANVDIAAMREAAPTN